MASSVLISLICFLYLLEYSACSMDVDSASPSQYVKCPGLYCGRMADGQGNLSTCGACERGYRPDESSLCVRCDGQPSFYEWLYLGFMVLLAPTLHWFFIDFTNKKKTGRLLALHGSALVESVVAALCTLLVLEPRGSLSVRSCPVRRVADWYTMLYNPRPGYTSTLHCTQEVVYPLYTMIMIYYAFGLIFMMLFRPLVSFWFVQNKGARSIYAALYFFPILVVVQAVFAGLLYYFFPYMTLVLSVITSATHFAFYQGMTVTCLLRETFTSPRCLVILLCHWLLHAYGIVAITEMRQPTFHGPLICLVPFPSLFYLLTVRYTDPDMLDNF